MSNASRNQSNAAGAKQLCTFVVDGLSLGIDVTRVQEVIRYQEMTPVPLAARQSEVQASTPFVARIGSV